MDSIEYLSLIPSELHTAPWLKSIVHLLQEQARVMQEQARVIQEQIEQMASLNNFFSSFSNSLFLASYSLKRGIKSDLTFTLETL